MLSRLGIQVGFLVRYFLSVYTFQLHRGCVTHIFLQEPALRGLIVLAHGAVEPEAPLPKLLLVLVILLGNGHVVPESDLGVGCEVRIARSIIN